MNYSFLPEKIKRELERRFGSKLPLSVLRSSGSIDGKSGEGYIVAFDDDILIFSRELGKSDFTLTGGKFGNDINSIALNKDKYNTFLDMKIAGRPISVKLSGFDEKAVSVICDKFNLSAGNQQGAEQKSDAVTARHMDASQYRTGENNARPVLENSVSAHSPASSQPRMSLSTGGSSAKISIGSSLCLATFLMYVAAIDRSVSEEENNFISTLFKGDKEILRKALELYKSNSFMEFLGKVKDSLKYEQKLCILANMIEIGMQDGTYLGAEQQMMDGFVKETRISQTDYKNISNILLIKNNISVMGD